MNTAIQLTDLSPVEQEVAHLSCWGYTQKEIAFIRKRSFFTVNNQVRSLHEKTGCRNSSEFTAWYFCSRFKISFDLSPISKLVVSTCMLGLLVFNIVFDNNCIRLSRSVKAGRTRRESTLNLSPNEYS